MKKTFLLIAPLFVLTSAGAVLAQEEHQPLRGLLMKRNQTKTETASTANTPKTSNSKVAAGASRTATADKKLLLFAPTSPMFMLSDKQNQIDKDEAQFMQKAWDSYIDMNDKSGNSYNDLARALSFALVTYFSVIDPTVEKDTNVKMEAVYKQISEKLLSGESLSKMSDEEKQQMAELWVVSSSLTSVLKMAGRDGGDKEQVKQAEDAARDYIEKMLGDPASSFRLTNKGLEQVK